MQDVFGLLAQVKRPDLLIRTARHGVTDHRRNLHLRRLMGYGPLPRHAEAVMRLMDMEAQLNDQRIARDPGYSVLRHVELLIAMMGEAQLLRAAHPVPVAVAKDYM